MEGWEGMRVLFFSSIVVSPAQGGGNAAYNLLESGPEWGEVFYATPATHPANWPPFPELTSRICWFSRDNRPLPLVRGARFNKITKLLNGLINRINDWVQRETIVRDVVSHVERLGVDVLLICPQNKLVDLPAAPSLIERTGLPSVAWFMDDYFTDEASSTRVAQVWSSAHRRFVASESMQKHYSLLFGGECEMLNNAVAFPNHFSEPEDSHGRPLRIVYAGAINSYYVDAMSAVLRELEGLRHEVEFDIYSTDELPLEWRSRTDVPWRHMRPIARSEFIERLRTYDMLLLLSSFEPQHRTLAETSQAGKMADYLAAGRCILAYGPAYADNIRYLKRYGMGECVTSQAPGALREAVLALAQAPCRRRELGKQAYYFGRENRDRAVYAAKLWRALQESAASPPARRMRKKAVGVWLRNVTFRTLHTLGVLKRSIRWIVKEKSNATGKG